MTNNIKNSHKRRKSTFQTVPRSSISEYESVGEVSDIPAPDRDSMRTYMQEIGKTPLLSKDEESDLAARIKSGDKSARDHMISANLRLVVKIAYD